MNKKHALIGAAILFVLAAVGWGLGWFDTQDPQVTELVQMTNEQFAKHDNLSDDDRQAGRQEFGEKMKGLSEEQRRAVFEASAPIFMKMMEARLDQFLAKTPEEQKAELDKRIDEMLARQKSGGGQGRSGPPGVGDGNSPPTPQQIDQFRKGMLDKTTPEQRAKFQMTMQMYQNRMKERGIDPNQGGGRFF